MPAGNPWTTMAIRIGTGIGAMRSRQIPLNEAFDEWLQRPTWFRRYSLSGRPSSSLDIACGDSRLPNGWFSILELDGRCIFGALRSGTVVAFVEKDERRRSHLSRLAAGELILAARAVSNGSPIHLTSVDLQTADRSNVREWTTTREQRVALADVVRIGQTPVVLHHWNIPTHQCAFQSGFERYFESENQRNLESLSQRAEEYCRRDAENRDKVARVLGELSALVAAGRHVTAHYAYRYPALVVNLAWLIGDVVHFNCHSGKDRTGFLHVEAKFLAYQLELARYRPVSSYLEPRTEEEEVVWDALLLRGGDLDIQQMNCGIRGSKLSRILACDDPFARRVGYNRWAEFKGPLHAE